MELQLFLKQLEQLKVYLVKSGDSIILKGINRRLTNQEKSELLKNKSLVNFIKTNKSQLLEIVDDEQQTEQRRDIVSIYGLSPVQEGMLFHSLYDSGSGSYLNQFHCYLTGNLLVPDFRKSFEAVLQAHTILRSSFHYQGFIVPVQCVHQHVELPLTVHDYSENPDGVQAFLEHDRSLPFDFSRAPLMRVSLLKLSAIRHKLVWTSHHILKDGWSSGIICNEVLAHYEQLVSGNWQGVVKEDRYEDYIRYLESQDKAAEEDYWKGYLSDFSGSSLLPFSDVKSGRNTGIGEYGELVHELGTELSGQLQEYCQANRLTPSTVLQGTWSYLLSKYTATDDVVFGVTVSGRPAELANSEERVGLFINTIPMRARLGADEEIKDWLQGLQLSHSASREYQYTSLSQIRSWHGAQDDLFDSILVYENYPDNDQDQQSLKAEQVKTYGQTNYLLTIAAWGGAKPGINFGYNSSMIPADDVDRIRIHFVNVLKQIVTGTAARLAGLRMLGEVEELQLLKDFQGAIIGRDTDHTILDLFEEQVKINADATAVVHDGVSINYARLNNIANGLALQIKEAGAGKNSFVPLLMSRGIDYVVAFLAVLKAGCAVVPLSIKWPAERTAKILDELQCDVVIYNNGIAEEQIPGLARKIPVNYSQIIPVEENVERAVTGDDPIYIIYTSGSTGLPKGVIVPHKGIYNRFKWMDEYFGKESSKAVLRTTKQIYDSSVWQLFWPLTNGGFTLIPNEDHDLDFEYLINLVHSYRIRMTDFVPSLFNSFVHRLANDDNRLNSLRDLVIGGEEIEVGATMLFKEMFPQIRITNLYGPTEASIGCIFYPVVPGQLSKIPIGKPIPNVGIHILDAQKQPVPLGVTGEIYIEGPCLALGYFNRPDTTAERFIIHQEKPFLGKRLYRTGDFARRRADGNIEYQGRMDDQVKIRGYRIELGEIENVMAQAPNVLKAVVLCRKTNADVTQLVVYVVGKDTSRNEIIDFLRTRLPDYMLPSQVIFVDEMPLTANGKVDKARLPVVEIGQQLSEDYAAPETPEEEQMSALWAELLGVGRVGLNDNFFELGGHSLLAIRLISSIRKAFGIELGVKAVFEYPRLGQLCSYLLEQNTATAPLRPVIARNAGERRFPLSYSQESLWFIDKLGGSGQYHMPAVLELQGEVNRAALSKALSGLVERHEILRTVIGEEEGVGYQEVLPVDSWAMSYREAIPKEEEAAYIRNYMERPFEMSSEPMFRVELLKRDEDNYLLLVLLHHIVSDGWSVSILVRELSALYGAAVQGKPANLAGLPVQYGDYAKWQRANISGEQVEGQQKYWIQKLSGVSPLELPLDYARPAVQSTKGNRVYSRLGAAESRALETLCKEEGVTLYMALLGVFNVLLYRYSGQADICVGTSAAGRLQKEVEGLIGYFVNTLAIRSDISGNPAFAEHLQALKSTLLESYSHQELPFEKVVEGLNQSRDLGRSSVFQVMFVLQNTPEEGKLDLGGIEASPVDVAINKTKFELTLRAEPDSEGIKLSIEYCSDLFSAERIENMLNHYQALIRSVLLDRTLRVGNLTMLDNAEEVQLLEDFQGEEINYSGDLESILPLFDKQVKINGDALAIVFRDKKLSYAELDRRANQVGNYLRSRGVGSGSMIGLCVNRSFEMIIGILGILKCGAAYVPIDPDYPVERISYILEDIKSNIVLTGEEQPEKLKEAVWKLQGITLIDLENNIHIERASKSPVDSNITGTDLAYVIYTSGSTGKPKGVMIEHSGLLNRLLWAQDYYKLTPEDRVLQKTTFCFDVSVWELLWPLLTGSSLHFAIPGGHRDSEYLKNFIERQKITMVHFVPSMLEVFLQDIDLGDCRSLKRVLCSGEALRPHHAALFAEKLPGIALFNLYGPTEASIDVTNYEVTSASKVLLGKPIANVKLYVAERDGGLAPVGVPGELYIGGIQVARGYLNRPELTAERFVDGVFPDSGRLYRTGDLVKWTRDGELEYLGRIDDQVKIRGYRIELGEIEQALLQIAGVEQSVVVCHQDTDGHKRLAGYVVSGSFNRDGIREQLRSTLPEYMVPSYIIALDELPLTGNGKVDKKRLPVPEKDLQDGQRVYQAPRTETETKLAVIWQELLGIKQVGINDNFFELGGDSIITIQVVSRARRAGLVLQPRDIFRYQNIAELAEAISISAVSQKQEKIQEVLSGKAGLLPIQQWFFEQDYAEVNHFNQEVLLSIDKKIGAPELNTALALLNNRHDGLRLRYQHKENGWEQSYSGMGLQLATELEGDENTISDICARYQSGLDISKGVVGYMVHIITPGAEAKNRLFIVLHHLVVDGVSWRIILEDLSAHLSGENQQSQPKTWSYKQWHEKLSWYALTERVQGHLGYWRNAVSKAIAYSTDHAAQNSQHTTASYTVSLDKEVTRKLLHESSGAYHTEINDLLLSALAGTLGSWQGRGSVVIGMEGHGREDIAADADVSQTTGWFTSLYPVLLELEGMEDTGELIRTVKEQLREIPDKGLSYGALRYLHPSPQVREELQSNAIFDVIFNYLGQLDNVVAEDGVLSGANEYCGPSSSAKNINSRKLSVTALVTDGSLKFRWNYAPELYSAATVQALGADLIGRMQSIISHCTTGDGLSVLPADYHVITNVQQYWVDEDLDREFKNREKNHGSIFSAFEISGNFNLNAFEKAIAFVLNRHESLRSTFHKWKSDYYLKVTGQYGLSDYYLYRDFEANAANDKAIDDFIHFKDHVFDMQQGPLFLIRIARINPDKFLFALKWHHVITDRWSNKVLYRDLMQAYHAFYNGGEPGVQALKYHFKDYLKTLHTSAYNRQMDAKRYWAYLYPANNILWQDKQEEILTNKMEIGIAENVVFTLPDALFEYFNKLSVSLGCTLFTVLQASWYLFSYKATGRPDIIAGTYVSGRDMPGVEEQIGCYAKTEIIRCVIDEDDSFETVIQKVKKANQDMADHGDYSLMRYLGDLLKGQINGPFWNINIVYESVSESSVGGDDELFTANGILIKEAFSQDDIKLNTIFIEKQLHFRKTATGIDLSINYNTGKITSQEMLGMVDEYFNSWTRAISPVKSNKNYYLNSTKTQHYGAV